MLNEMTFESVVAVAPLPSIDLCLVVNERLLMGRRNNEPLKGEWFTPGGCIKKNETWQNALLRVAKTELNFDIDIKSCSLMGVWDHFYSNSFAGPEVSTHYVNLPHVCYLEEAPKFTLDDQHAEVAWFSLSEIIASAGYHEYMCSYASWLRGKRGSGR